MSRCPHCGGNHGADNHFCPVTGNPIELGPRLIGQMLLDHFHVVTILGEGPTGIVLEVEDVRTKQHLAAKLIHPQFTRQGNTAETFLAEAERAGKLDCEHIATVVETGRDTGAAPAVVRELMVGRCLEDVIEESGRLQVADATRITRDSLRALDAVHRAGIANLDLSPADIFLDRSSGRVVTKLVDFGEGPIKAGLSLPDGDEPDSHAYYAPEQRRKGFQADQRADVYAAGAVFYHMLTGQPPARIPSPVNSKRKDIEPKLAAVVHKSLAAAPDNRYQSAGDFLAALEDAAGDLLAAAPEPVAPAAAPQPEPSDKVPSTKKTLVAASAAPVPPAEQAPQPPAPAPEASSPAGGAPEPSAPEPEKTDQPQAPPEEPRAEEANSSQEENEQPSVIVDMPEVAAAARNKKIFAVVGVVVGLAIMAGVVLFLTGPEDESAAEQPARAEKIELTIRVTPAEAAVTVDGKRVEGDPPVLKVDPDGALHTVQAKAEGFEPLQKDVAFDESKLVELELMEIIEPEEPTAEEPAAEEPDIQEIETPEDAEDAEEAAEEIEEAEEEIAPEEPVEKKPAAKKPAAKKPAAKKPAEKKPAAKTPPAKKPAEKKKKKNKKKGGFDVTNPYG
ncbi:MAG: serine/threonine-protein kinase [Polyangia bacterium]